MNRNRILNPIGPLAERLRAWQADARLAWLGYSGGGNLERRSRLGEHGERLAARYLKWRGYRILERNFRAAGAEIDLIAMHGETLVFVEVKARFDDSAGAAAEAVDERKQHRIRKAAQVYLTRNRAHDRPVRFDVVAIDSDGQKYNLKLLKDAF